ncbi:MAG: class I SAM-dependent methyltransferase [Alphaproteobacteria bacterium]|nr:class I SAM-dependent methyltransferase [Alphaproteobacteria bacterium]
MWSLNRSNHNMNDLTLKSLEISPDDRVLELGFGGGALLNEIISSNPQFAAGVEISDLAIRQMLQWNKDAVADGRLEIARGEEEAIPFPDGRFTKICCVNVVYFWDDTSAMLSEILRVLEPGGKFVVCYQPEGPNNRSVPPELIESNLHSAGFIDPVTCKGHDKQNGDFFCTTAVRPALKR